MSYEAWRANPRSHDCERRGATEPASGRARGRLGARGGGSLAPYASATTSQVGSAPAVWIDGRYGLTNSIELTATLFAETRVPLRRGHYDRV
jgi:hypothetical protein